MYAHGWGKAEHSNVGAATNNDIESQVRQVCVHWLLVLRVPEAVKIECYQDDLNGSHGSKCW